MTTAIKTSLTKLNNALQSLENSASEMQDNVQSKIDKAEASAKKSNAKSSHDLFSVPSAAKDDVDAKALASRLDGAIAKVEKLLKEG